MIYVVMHYVFTFSFSRVHIMSILDEIPQLVGVYRYNYKSSCFVHVTQNAANYLRM